MPDGTVIVDVRGSVYNDGLLEMDRRVAYRIALSILTMLALGENHESILVEKKDEDALPPMR